MRRPPRPQRTDYERHAARAPFLYPPRAGTRPAGSGPAAQRELSAPPSPPLSGATESGGGQESDGPGAARSRAGRRGRRTFALLGLGSWLAHGGAVLGTFDGPEDADGGRLEGAPGQAGSWKASPARRGSRRGRGGRPRPRRPPRRSGAGRRDPGPPRLELGAEADGLAVDEGDELSARASLAVIFSNAPSLKTLQFW